MKILKTTYLLMAILLMTVSGTSSDTLTVDRSNTEIKEFKSDDFIVHCEKDKRKKLTSNG